MRNQDYKPYFMTNKEWYTETLLENTDTNIPEFLRKASPIIPHYELTEKGKALKRVVQSYKSGYERVRK